MRLSKLLRWLAPLALTASLGACDWIHFSFMNSIPFKGKRAEQSDFYVYLGVDGLSYHTARTAMDGGAFAGPEWHLSKFVTMFPGTSDASWTRTLRTPKIGGYEIEYYDPTKDQVIDRGLVGLAKHIMPSFADFASFEFDYLHAFDYMANGYLHGIEAYRDTYVSIGDTLDNLFTLLGGRIETTDVFAAYLLEFDVLGHMQNSQDVQKAFGMLAKRIEKFRSDHPNRNVHFTLLSDHGMDFIRVQGDHFIKFDDELRKVGVLPVDHLSGYDPKSQLFAIPIMHTRVTYLALHTHPDLVRELAGRVSTLSSVDMAISRLRGPQDAGLDDAPEAPHPLDWYAIWAEGKIAIAFGFDPGTDQYYLPAGQRYTLFGYDPKFAEDERYKILSDDEIFAATRHTDYPDMFYRARTSITPVSTVYPADVMVSFKPSYCSLGFTLPGSDDIASAGFHGNMHQLGSLGTLLTNERQLPDVVRSDTFLELFPRMRDHMRKRGVEVIEGDRNASLQYP